MRQFYAKYVGIFCFVLFLSSIAWSEAKNVVIMIGDGMGPEQIKAGRFYNGAPLSFESLPNQGKVTTYSADNAVTDSAAAATAIATGHKVNNGVISMAYPGDGSELETLLEFYKASGKSTGLVTTVYMTHATPAGFGAHETSRNNNVQIGMDYLTQTQPNLILGGAYYMKDLNASNYGYSVISTRSELFEPGTLSAGYISGQFGTTSDGVPYEAVGDFSVLPHLSEMTQRALDILEQDTDGFFLMVEGGKIDWACHDNNIAYAVPEVVEFSNAVDVVLTWASGRSDTLIIVTADHETGGLTVTQDNGPGVIPSVTWSTTNHTGTDVDIFATGVNSELVTGTMNNTEIVNVVLANTDQTFDPVPATGSTDIELQPTLSWSCSGNVASYDIYFGSDQNAVANANRTSPEYMGNQTSLSWTTPELAIDTTWYWSVDSVDAQGGILALGDVWSFSTISGPNAYAQQDPTIYYGALSGDGIVGLDMQGDGLIQAITEGPNGVAGASSLDAVYELVTSADPSSITSLELLSSINWIDSDGDDYLHASILNVITTGWEEITSQMLSGSWSASSPTDYVDASGVISIRFTDTYAVKKENKGTLELDLLYAIVQTGTVEPDVTPPIISNIAVSYNHNSATITWTTDEPADSQVDYGLDAGLGTTQTNSQLVTSHSINLSGLQAETTYYFAVSSMDASENLATSSIDTFTTESEPTTTLIHIEDLRITAVIGKKTYAEVEADVADDTSLPVEGAAVIGDFYFRDAIILQGASGTTNSSGTATIVSPERNVKSGDVFRFVVTDIVMTNGTYDAGADVISDISVTVP